MGPFTRAIRIVFAGVLGALAGFVVSLVVDAVLHEATSSVSGQRPAAVSLGAVAMVVLMLVGGVVGALVGAAGRRKTYHDES